MEHSRMVGYGRVSTDQDRQLDSLEHQVAFFTQFAQTHGYQLVKVYADEGISGKQLKNRREFLRMLDDARGGGFDVVVVKDVSRFARNTVDLLTSVRALKAMGVNVLFVNNSQQTMGESEFVLTLLGAMAQEESANLSKRVRFGKDITARRGRVPREVLGYDRIDNFTLRINREEADLVRRVYRLYLSGEWGMGGIARLLEAEGLRTRKGCPYTEGSIRRILTNPLYCGELVNHKTVTLDFMNGVVAQVPEDQRYRHSRPEWAIVSREEFEAVQALRRSRHRARTGAAGEPGRRYSGRYLLSGLVRCAHCGRTMIRVNQTRAGGRVDSYWRCPAGTHMKGEQDCDNHVFVRDDALTAALSHLLGRLLDEREGLARALWARTRGADQGARVEEARRRQRGLQQQRERSIALFRAGVITLEEVKADTNRIGRQLEETERALQAARTAPGLEEARGAVEDFVRLEGVTNGELRQLIRAIEVGPDRQVLVCFRAGGAV